MADNRRVPAPQADEADLRPRARTASWLAALAHLAGEHRAAEGHLLELLSWCAFSGRSN